MTRRSLSRLLLAYLLLLALAAVIVERRTSANLAPAGLTIVSVWQHGERRARAVTTSDPSLVRVPEMAAPGATTVYEHVVSEGRVLSANRLLFCLSFGSARDGVHARYAGRDAYLTPDDLIRHDAYSVTTWLGSISLRCGIDAERALRLLGNELNVSSDVLWEKGVFTRIAARREIPGAPARDGFPLTQDGLRNASLAAAQYLARNLNPDGTFRYEVDARTNRDIPGYNWPRHSGAAFFLAEAASYFRLPELTTAARLSAQRLARHATLQCGTHRCIGDSDRVDLGSAALALLTYIENVRGGIDGSFLQPATELAEFLRSMQRPDGQFMHIYDRAHSRPVDVQYGYYTGEAALALARLYHLTHDRRDFEAARAALAYTVHERWSFFGSRYYFDSEHWTCQAMAEMWDEAPDRDVLRFCMDWLGFNRALQADSHPLGPFAGGFTDPLTPPRVAVAGSRSEGALGTLVVMRKAGVSPEEIALVTEQIERALGLALRFQFVPGPSHLFRDPAAMAGGVPGSPVDLSVRIDYPQHVGSAFLRYAALMPQRD